MRISWLMLLNILAQFLFIRIFRSEFLDAKYPRRGYEVYQVRYGVMFFVLPLTGWWGRYASIGKPRMKYLTGMKFEARRMHG